MYRYAFLNCQDLWQVSLVVTNHHIVLFTHQVFTSLYFTKFIGKLIYLLNSFLILFRYFSHLFIQGIGSLKIRLILNLQFVNFLFKVIYSLLSLIRAQFVLPCQTLVQLCLIYLLLL